MKNRVLRRFADRVAQLDLGGLQVPLRDILFSVLDRDSGIFGVGDGTRKDGDGDGKDYRAPWTTAATALGTLGHRVPFLANHRHAQTTVRHRGRSGVAASNRRAWAG